MAKFQNASVTEMIVKVLPEIATAVASPLANVDSITMYGDGNGGKMVGDIMNTMNQITEGSGINVKNLIESTLTGRAMGRAIAESNDMTPKTE